jgi:hypothetical protein
MAEAFYNALINWEKGIATINSPLIVRSSHLLHDFNYENVETLFQNARGQITKRQT